MIYLNIRVGGEDCRVEADDVCDAGDEDEDDDEHDCEDADEDADDDDEDEDDDDRIQFFKLRKCIPQRMRSITFLGTASIGVAETDAATHALITPT